MNNQEQPIEEQNEVRRSLTVKDDPFQKSYQESAIQYFPYRIFLVIVAIGFLQLGKSSLPQDSVPCIEDEVNDAFQPVADFFNQNSGFGLTLMTIMQIVCDLQIIGMVFYWMNYGNSFVYPIAVGFLGFSKILINILFKTKSIQNAFTQRLFPSLLFGDNFENTYFFSGITALLVINLLQFWKMGFKRLFFAQIGIMIYVIFLLLSMRLNFFMDIITALAFGYIVYTLLDQSRDKIDRLMMKPFDKITQCFDKKGQLEQ